MTENVQLFSFLEITERDLECDMKQSMSSSFLRKQARINLLTHLNDRHLGELESCMAQHELDKYID